MWVWLPGAAEAVVAGVIARDGERYVFGYARSYLERSEAASLYEPELPLRPGPIDPPAGLPVAGCLRDAGPDGWGQQLVWHAMSAGRTRWADDGEPSLLTLLLESDSDRIGALDFQDSPTEYVERTSSPTLDQLVDAAGAFAEGRPIAPGLDAALLHGTSVGGARPKVLVAAPDRPGWIAKLSVSTDPYPVVGAEGACMRLAGELGLDVPPTATTTVLGRQVLLVERFDRTARRPQRRAMVSALTLLGLDEVSGRYATYPDFAEVVRARFDHPDETLRELFGRLVFNVCISNTDDHARNHAAFWDGRRRGLSLTPAYDLCPQLRSGDTAAQAMAITADGRRASRLGLCVEAAPIFHLDRRSAEEIVDRQVSVIAERWAGIAAEVGLSEGESDALWGRQILNPAIHYHDY